MRTKRLLPFLGILSLLLVHSTQSDALTITVTDPGDTSADTGTCTLREAVNALNSQTASGSTAGECGQGATFNATSDTIQFDLAALGGNTITLTGGALTLAGNTEPAAPPITPSITIEGPGAGQLTIDGNGGGRIFEADDTCGGPCSGFIAFNAIIKGLTITNGAGVQVIDENSGLTLDGVAITNNTTATNEGGGVRVESGVLTIMNSLIANNSTTAAGGGVAILSASGPLTIENSVVSGNTAGDSFDDHGGGIFNGGGAALTVESSTIFDNFAGDSGGGLFNTGTGSTLTVTNSTISGNQAQGDGGGIVNDAGGTNTVALLNVTITDNISDSNTNAAGEGGGISQRDGAGAFTVTNSIIAGNTDMTTTAADCDTQTDDTSDVSSGGNNFIGDIAGCGDNTFNTDSAVKNDQLGNSAGSGIIDPLLATLDPSDGGNPATGGLTGIHLPQVGSPVIDAVIASIAAAPGTDQRGVSRPIGSAADIGAVEVGCGNGTVESGEECDDGNTTDGDGCSAACENEGGGGACGDGNIDAGEQCDDGDTTSGDGCSSTCTNEVTPACGDNILQAGEECDDDNTNNGDGCSSTCKTESSGGCSLIRQ